MKKFFMAVMIGIFSNCFEIQSAIVQNSQRKSIDEKLDSLLKFSHFKITSQDGFDVVAQKCLSLQEKVNSDAVSILSSLIKNLPTENLTPEQNVRSLDLQNLMFRTTELSFLFEKHAVEMIVLSKGNPISFKMLDAFSATIIQKAPLAEAVIYELTPPVMKSSQLCIDEAKRDYQKLFNFVMNVLNFCDADREVAARLALMYSDPEAWRQYELSRLPQPQILGLNLRYRDLSV